MRELTLFSLGKTKYGIWQDEVPVVKDIGAIHWLPPVPSHIAGLTILDGSSLTLFDLPACIGLSPISKEKASYPVLLVEHGKNIAGFMVDFIIGHFSMASEAVYPMPDYLRTPIIDTCAMYDSELIPLINTAELFKRALQADFEPSVSEFRTCGIKPEKISSIKTVRVFESGGESFAVCGACIEKAAVKPGRVTRPPLLPSYVGGVTFNNGNPTTLIHLSRRMKMAEKGTWQQMLVADIAGQGFGLLVDSDRGQWDDANLTFKPVPPLAQSDWIQGAALDGKEIIPIIELGGLMSDQSDGSGEPPFPQRYTPDARFKSLFGRQEIKVLEFSLLGVRHAIPEIEVEDHFRVRIYRRLPNVLPIVAGVAEYKGELLPVIDPAACFDRVSPVNHDWRMILVKNGDFRALVLTEKIFGDRLLPVMMHRGLPFDEPHTLVYGCYPDEATVRLVLNIEALAVHFDKVLYKEFFATLSKEIPLEPIEIESEPEPKETAVISPDAEAIGPLVSEKPEEHVESQEVVPIAAALVPGETEEENELPEPEDITAIEEPEDILAVKEIADTELERPQTGVSDEIIKEPVPVETAVVGPAEETIDLVESEKVEESVEPEKSMAANVDLAPEEAEEENGIVKTKAVEPDKVTAMATALVSGGVEDEKGIRELDKTARPDEETSTEKPEGIGANEATAELRNGQRTVEIEGEVSHLAVSEEIQRQPQPERMAGGEERFEVPAAQDAVDTEAVIRADMVSEEISRKSQPEEITETEEQEAKQEANEIAEIEPEALQIAVSEETGRESEIQEAELSDQAEEGVQFIEPEEYAEPEEQAEPIEPEKEPVVTAFVPPVETAPVRDEAADDYCQDDDREKPKNRLAIVLIAALLLIGALTTTLYTLDVFERWTVTEKNGKPETLAAVVKPGTTPAKTQKYFVSEKSPFVKSAPAPLKTQKPFVPEKPPAVSPVSKINTAQKVEPRSAVATKPIPTTQAKSSKRHVPKKSSSILRSPEPREVKKERSEESAAAVKYDITLIKSLEQVKPDMLSSNSHGYVIHNVKKGDTLWKISKHYTGTGFNYPGVAIENKIPSPDLIVPKQKIKIRKRGKYEKQSFKNMFK